MRVKMGLLSTACGAILMATASAQVVINEIVYDGVGSDDGQPFVEIFGPAGTDISGWTLQAKETDNTDNNEMFTFPAGTLIPADGILVVADEEGSTGTTLVANADFIVNDMDPENGGDGMHLLDDTDTLIDAMAYGDTTAQVGEGLEARDIFAPLSLERCPAGSDTGDNATDFTPNFPTPGFASDNCNAMEWVNFGFSDTISLSAGEGVGLDFWLTGAPNEPYFVLWSCFDPGTGIPFDNICTPISISLADLAPFIAWRGNLDATGASVGTAALDFSTAPFIGLGVDVPVWMGALAFNPSGPGFFNTNNIVITLQD